MKIRSTLTLLALVVVAALLAILLSGKPEPPKTDSGASLILLPGFEADAVQSITIDRPGEPSTVCRRQDGGWQMTEPVQTPADGKRLERILSDLQAATTVATFALPDPASGAPYGLTPAGYTLTLTAPAGEVERRYVVKFGKPMPVGNLAYAAVEGSHEAVAIRSGLADAADVSSADLRSNVLVTGLDPDALQALAVSADPLDDQPGFRLECRRSDDRWELTYPVRDLADADAVTKIVTAIRRYRATKADLVTGSPDEYGLDVPGITVTLTSPEGASTVLVSRHGDDYYAMSKSEPAPMRVPAEFFSALRRTPDDLRDRAPAHVLASEVASVELAGPSGDVTLVRREDTWQLDGNKPVPADAPTVNDLLDAIAAARAQSFVADTPEDRVSEVVTLREANGKTLAELHLDISPSTGDVYATRQDFRTVLRLAKDERLAAAFAGRLGLLNRTLLRARAADAFQIDLQNPAGTFRVESKEDWRLTAPATGAADEDAIRAIQDDLADLHAEGFAAETDDEPARYGLDKPQATVTVSYRAIGSTVVTTHTLSIGAAAGDGYYAALDSDGRVCILPGAVLDHLRANLASKVICRARGLTGLTFGAGGRAVQYHYNPGTKQWTDADNMLVTGLQRVRLDTAAGVLSDFRAKAVADYVEKDPALYGFDRPYLEIDLGEPNASGKRVIIGSRVEGGGRYVMGPVTGFVLVADDADVTRLGNAVGLQ